MVTKDSDDLNDFSLINSIEVTGWSAISCIFHVGGLIWPSLIGISLGFNPYWTLSMALLSK